MAKQAKYGPESTRKANCLLYMCFAMMVFVFAWPKRLTQVTVPFLVKCNQIECNSLKKTPDVNNNKRRCKREQE